MIDIKLLREHSADYIAAAARKNVPIDIPAVIAKDDERKKITQQLEELRAIKNKTSKDIPQLTGEARAEAIARMQAQGDTEKELGVQLEAVETALRAMLLRVPNIMHPDVPTGHGSEDNVEVKTYGQIRTFEFEPVDHFTLMQKNDWVDVERAVKMAGARAYMLKGEAFLLEQALHQLALKKIVSKGFTPFSVPHFVSPQCFEGTGYFPGGEDDAYHLTKDDMYLIATAEIPLYSYYSGEILAEADLPKLMAGYSPCYRREAGSYGKDTQGLYRHHQFNKVEQVVLCAADVEESNKWHTQILENTMELLNDLAVPYRLLQLCSGDLAIGKYNSHDLECYMYSRGGYGETHSATSFLDFQARRLNLRYRASDGTVKYCYTLNNTVLATPRFMIALLEHYQNADGTLTVPSVLRPILGQDVMGRAWRV